MFIKHLSTILTKFGSGFIVLSKKLYQSPHQKRVQYFKRNTGKFIRLDYPLNKKSIVVDVGGYEGQWASDIFSRFQCSVYIFEPVPAFASSIKERFSHNQKIKTFSFGLADKNIKTSISLGEDRSSIYTHEQQSVEIQLNKATDVFKELGLTHINLMKVNIEGGEYSLLEHLIKSGFIKQIENLQVQFHDFVPEAEHRMIMIQKALERTHRPTYQYRFVWENWERSSSTD